MTFHNQTRTPHAVSSYTLVIEQIRLLSRPYVITTVTALVFSKIDNQYILNSYFNDDGVYKEDCIRKNTNILHIHKTITQEKQEYNCYTNIHRMQITYPPTVVIYKTGNFYVNFT